MMLDKSKNCAISERHNSFTVKLGYNTLRQDKFVSYNRGLL